MKQQILNKYNQLMQELEQIELTKQPLKAKIEKQKQTLLTSENELIKIDQKLHELEVEIARLKKALEVIEEFEEIEEERSIT